MSNRKLRLSLAVTALLLLTSGTALAVSGAGAIALEFPAGGRYNAMGEAGTALAQDATAMWWNPGGMAFATDTHKRRLHVMQTNLVPDLADDIALYWGGYAARYMGGSLGFSITFLDMGEQMATDDAGTDRGNFDSNMWAAGLTYGTKVTQNLGIGMSAKFFRDSLADDNAMQDSGGSGSTFALDVGALWKVPSLRTNLAASISNLGPDITHVDSEQSDPLPRKITFGIANNIFYSEATSLLFVADLLVPLLSWDTDKDDYTIGMDFGEKEWGVGLEWSYVQSLFVRFGYKKGTGEIEDYTMGMGMNLQRFLGKSLSFDYASVPQATGLERVNRISLAYDF
jgi:type IX secretion system protein PorV